MIDKGQVIEVKNNQATVRIFRSSACGNCNMCGLSNEQKFIDLAIPNTVGAVANDWVELHLKKDISLKITAIVYLIPLFISLLLTIGGSHFSLPDWSLICIFIGGLGIGFFVVRYIDKKIAQNMDIIPEIIRIIPKEEQNENY